MRRITRAAWLILVSFVLAGQMLVSPVYAAEQGVSVKIAPKALLVDAGQAVKLKVAVRCPQGHIVLEAFVYVVQDDFTSDFAAIPVQCNGKKAQYDVRVEIFEGGRFT